MRALTEINLWNLRTNGSCRRSQNIFENVYRFNLNLIRRKSAHLKLSSHNTKWRKEKTIEKNEGSLIGMLFEWANIHIFVVPNGHEIERAQKTYFDKYHFQTQKGISHVISCSYVDCWDLVS